MEYVENKSHCYLCVKRDLDGHKQRECYVVRKNESYRMKVSYSQAVESFTLSLWKLSLQSIYTSGYNLSWISSEAYRIQQWSTEQVSGKECLQINVY